MVINRIGPVSAAKISGTLYAIIGLILGALFSVFAMSGLGSGSSGMGAMFGIGAVILLPLLYGCLGFVATLIGAWLYNVLAKMVGGVELDVT